jgi:hypothetical protein
LGLGYIFVQVVLIQRFTLFIGYPTVAITTTIFSMLCFSALGSLASRRLIRTAGHLQLALLSIAGLALLYVLGLPGLLSELLTLPDLARAGLSVLIIGPLAFVMGMPFPNGVFSVLGSVLVILVSMLASFTAALSVAAVFYAVAATVASALWNADSLASTVRAPQGVEVVAD